MYSLYVHIKYQDENKSGWRIANLDERRKKKNNDTSLLVSLDFVYY